MRPASCSTTFLVAFQNDCIRLIESGYTNPADLDAGVRLGLGYRMGPMRLLDIEGLDIHRTVSLSMYEQLKDPRYIPPPLVDRMIDAGPPGRENGQEGFTPINPRAFSASRNPKKTAANERDLSQGQPIADAVKESGRGRPGRHGFRHRAGLHHRGACGHRRRSERRRPGSGSHPHSQEPGRRGKTRQDG